MENTDSNIKSQTGGLKLMTVFVAVLALHVVVIGGMTAYYMLKGGNSDGDILADKTHKTVKVTPDGAIVSDGPTADGDKTAATAPSADNSPTVVASTTPAETAPTETPVTSPANTTPVTTASTPMQVTTPAALAHAGTTTPAPTTTAPIATADTTPAVTTTATPAQAGNGTPYVVKSRDSLAKIARVNHTTVAKLKAQNNLTSDMLHIGQTLTIPAKAATVADATTTPEASTATTILGATPATTKAVTPVATMSKTADAVSSTHHMYTVVKGDTLTKIAHKFKTSTKAIMTANNMTDAAKLSIGEKLKIPSKESRSATTVQPPASTQPSEVKTKTTGSTQLATFAQ